jgi:hypothetical protein
MYELPLIWVAEGKIAIVAGPSFRAEVLGAIRISC